MPSLTLNYTAAEGQRIATAVGHKFGLGRDATQAEIKAVIINDLAKLVSDEEAVIANQAIVTQPPIAPT